MNDTISFVESWKNGDDYFPRFVKPVVYSRLTLRDLSEHEIRNIAVKMEDGVRRWAKRLSLYNPKRSLRARIRYGNFSLVTSPIHYYENASDIISILIMNDRELISLKKKYPTEVLTSVFILYELNNYMVHGGFHYVFSILNRY